MKKPDRVEYLLVAVLLLLAWIAIAPIDPTDGRMLGAALQH